MNLPDPRRKASDLPSWRAADPATGQGRRKERAGSPSLHGRQKGKKLGIHHKALLKQLLPELSIDLSQPLADPSSLFGGAQAPLWLEIGFGGGEHLADEASLFPQMNFIGCEAFLNGMAKALELIHVQGLKNIRLHQGNAQHVLERLPAGALDGIYLLYPDPWPKRRQHKRRFISDEVLAELARVMRKGAELRFATDIDDYAGWTLARILRSKGFIWRAEDARDWQQPWPNWRGTRYEAKALAQGRRPVYLTFMRK